MMVHQSEDDRFLAAREVVRRRLLAVGVTHHDAEDLAQAATLEAYRRRDTIRHAESFPAFAWTIAKRLAWRQWNQRREAVTAPDDVVLIHAPDPQDVGALVVDRHDVRSVLGRLSARDRDLLWSHHAEGDPLDVLAARYGLAPSSMPRILTRARENYRAASPARDA